MNSVQENISWGLSWGSILTTLFYNTNDVNGRKGISSLNVNH